LIELKNMSVAQGYIDLDDFGMPEFYEDNKRRDSSAFIVKNSIGVLQLLIPYDSGVCYRIVDISRLIEFLCPEQERTIHERLHKECDEYDASLTDPEEDAR